MWKDKRAQLDTRTINDAGMRELFVLQILGWAGQGRSEEVSRLSERIE